MRQKQFSQDEQRALAGCRASLILDAADEVVLRATRQRFNSVPTVPPIPTSYCCSSSTSPVHTLEDDVPPVDSAVDMDESILESFRWMDDDDELDLTLDDYHTHLTSSTEPTSRHTSRRPSFRRALSLTALPQVDAQSPTAAERDYYSIPLPMVALHESHRRDRSQSRGGQSDAAPSRQIPVRSTDPSTRYYQDPEARLKLRVYLASPSKFDEALEFGFPSLESTEQLPQPKPSAGPRSRSTEPEPEPETFYDSENPSFLDSFDSDSDDAESLPEMDTPNTPSDAMFFRNTHRLPTSMPPSSDIDRPFPKNSARTVVKPIEPRQHIHQPYVVPGCNREMTLRMTLTRPDLRASEDLLYGSGDNDPLALEHLPITAGKNDIWDQGKESGGTVRSLWRRLSKR